MPAFDFNPNELQRLGRLVFAVANTALDEAPGSRRSRRVGQGTDFMDFRPYIPGDDFRRIDWNLFGRLRQLFIRLHEAPKQLSVSLLVDMSRSMEFGAPQSKMNMALRVACALAFVALRGGDRLRVHCFADELRCSIGPLTSPRALPTVVKFLQRATPGKLSDLHRAVRTLRARHQCRGLLIVISDFLNVPEVETALGLAMGGGARIMAVQILDALDRGAGLSGTLRLRDSETGELVDVQIDERTLASYQKQFEAHRQQLEDFCRRRGQNYLLADTSGNYLQLVSQALRSKAVPR